MNFSWYVDQNIPFAEKGRDIAGVDCWGLVRLFYKRELNIDLPVFLESYRNTKDVAIAAKILEQKEMSWLEAAEPKSGDVVLCRMRSRPMHVGIYKHPGLMLHIEKNQSPTIEPLGSLKWCNRVLGIYRLKN